MYGLWLSGRDCFVDCGSVEEPLQKVLSGSGSHISSKNDQAVADVKDLRAVASLNRQY